ncbi:hypothetical protein GCM10025877_26340 [Agromyces mangrovi Wang et al. 2018]|nr:hypothetical protein GCM10025877_26340 [Agromyces mangrovi]
MPPDRAPARRRERRTDARTRRRRCARRRLTRRARPTRRVEGPRRGPAAATRGERGAATAEYAVATMAAVGFAGLLVIILRGDEVRGILTDLVRNALTVG